MKKEPLLEIDKFGTKRYYLDGRLHREDGPAIEKTSGEKHWCRNGQFYREDGPAIELPDGQKEWWINNLLHREDGPAIEYFNGHKIWYYHGQRMQCNSQEEFEKIIRLRAFW